MATNEVRCTYTQLRTKIMNEQNKLQAKAKGRLQKCQIINRIVNFHARAPRAGPGVELARRPPSCEVSKNLTE